MQFLNIGPMEMILILVLALIVFGPGKLPEIGRSVGKSIGEFRRATSDLTREFTTSIDEVKQPFADLKDSVSGTTTAAKASIATTGLVCPSCSVGNPLTNKFCKDCGARLLPEEATVDCPSCLSPNPVSNKFCRDCGSPMPIPAPEETPAEVAAASTDSATAVYGEAETYVTAADADAGVATATDESAEVVAQTPEPGPEVDPTLPEPQPADNPTLPDPRGQDEEIPYIDPTAPDAPPQQVSEQVSEKVS